MASKKNVVETPAADEMVETLVVAASDALVEEDVNFSQMVVDDEFGGSELTLRPEDVIIPTLKIMQDSSKMNKAFKGREQERHFAIGDIYDSTTGKIYKGTEGVLLVPISVSHCVIEREPSPSGKFIAKLRLDNPRVLEALKENNNEWKKLVSNDKAKNQLNYTDEVLVALLDPADGVTPVSAAVVAFAGTNVWPRKQWWNDMMATRKVPKFPRYGFRTLLKTEYRPASTPGGLDSYKFKAVPYREESWEKSRSPFVTNPETKIAAPSPKTRAAWQRCKELEKLYSTGVLGKADYSDADSDESESAREAAAFNDKPAF